MDFDTAIRINEVSERNAKIEAQIYDHDWSDAVDEHLRYGGWPGDIQIE